MRDFFTARAARGVSWCLVAGAGWTCGGIGWQMERNHGFWNFRRWNLGFVADFGIRISSFRDGRRVRRMRRPQPTALAPFSRRLDQPFGQRRKLQIHGAAGQLRQPPALQQRIARMATEAAHTPFAHFDAPYHTGRRLNPQLRQPQQARHRWRPRPVAIAG